MEWSIFLSVFILFAVLAIATPTTSDAAEKKLTASQWYEQGNQLLNSKDYDRAIAAYTETVNLNPQNADAYNRRGLIYKIRKQYDLAIVDFTKTIELAPANSSVYYNRGDSYFIYSYTVRGNAYSNKGQHDLALADFDKVIELDKTYAQAYYFKGLLFNGLKKKQEAIDNYKKFLQYAKPDDISIDMVKKSIKELEQELN